MCIVTRGSNIHLMVPCQTNFLTVSRKSHSVATFLQAWMTNILALWATSEWYPCGARESVWHTSVTTDFSSAPVVFGHKQAMRSNQISCSMLECVLCLLSLGGQTQCVHQFNLAGIPLFQTPNHCPQGAIFRFFPFLYP